jgi:o-succinylbenzoate synthase
VKTKILPYTLRFKRPAGTSRGVYHDHKVWYVIVYDENNPNHWGVGECAPLLDLSCDYNDNYEQTLHSFCQNLEQNGKINTEQMRSYPSMLFGLETAVKHYETGSFGLWNTPFSRHEAGIPINGLVWMGDYRYMLEQVESKMQQGFRCIKLKIGAINFDDELQLLRHIRNRFSEKEITLRVDANGNFPAEDALSKLNRLSELGIHSIEQPIKAGQWEKMAALCRQTPIPIALDEELIGVNNFSDKEKLLNAIHPQYIILKPTLHGGIAGAEEWITLEQAKKINWWATSALESNIGLNCIAQWAATFNNPLPQGLGTGLLYTNNVEMPLDIKGDCLWFNPDGKMPNVNEIGKQ